MDCNITVSITEPDTNEQNSIFYFGETQDEHPDKDVDISSSYIDDLSELTVEQLLRIYKFYKISGHVKPKLKKDDLKIIILWFESQVENQPIVNERHHFWRYMEELNDNVDMRQYIIW